ncbi:two-component sensor histidine kinase [Actinomadura sp. CNU-125]|uniref:sensor histidine kinase n=1 Tax=Actinomadura sp. CNU-125 TaxID=1904961 RepID=UPI00095FA2C6|nr:HAMP domain-containing sensor histidine kinase [Actinomadura sp. CNU-125]OLT12003.1 two-component sensor histidine kinase [Actinomadura sp. CNU-125]
MTAGRSLRTRLALGYAAGVYAAGIFVLVLVLVPLTSVDAGTPVGGPPSPVTTGEGPGIGLTRLLAGSAVALVVLIPVALALGWFVAGRFLRPLRAITAAARDISAGDLHRRLDLGEPADELTELGRTLDDLFARLQASFDAQRHFVANASHELRTPLAGLRTLLEVALADPDADADDLRAACEEALALGGHQERLVRALLVLATGERGVSRMETFDLGEVVEGVLAARRDQAAERGVDLAGETARAVLAGDPGLVESLVANLVDNAVRHNGAGGHVRVAARTSGAHVTLTVVNSGPVVPGDQIERLFQPFQRLAPDRDGRRDGHGLGLAIVGAVARAHRAALDVRARPEGGLSVVVRFAAGPPAR